MNFSYDEHPRQSLTVYTPIEPRATLFFFYGGGWTKGNKGEYAFFGRTLSRLGYQVIIPDYRLYPEVRFPDFIDDAAKAIAFSHCQLPIQLAEKRVIIGHSAGAYIAAILTFDATYLDSYLNVNQHPKKSLKMFSSFVGLSGPYDFLPDKSALLNSIFTEQHDEQVSQPVNYVDGDEPISLLIHGTDDDTVRIENSQSLAAKINIKGGQVETIYYPDTAHASTIIAFSGLGRPKRNQIVSDTIGFIERTPVQNPTHPNIACQNYSATTSR